MPTASQKIFNALPGPGSGGLIQKCCTLALHLGAAGLFNAWH
jgi:hypothetical protein